MLEAILWFVGGALSYNLVSRLLGVSKLVLLFTELHVCVLYSLKMADDNLKLIRETKLELSENPDEENEEKLKGFYDEDAVNVWRNLVIMNLINLTPKYFRGLIKYRNWDEAMLYLRRVTKNIKFE